MNRLVNRNRSSVSRRTAFTLTELLVVVAIIGILATLVTQVTISAIRSAKNTMIQLELKSMQGKLYEEYFVKDGAYPPCDLRWANSDSLAESPVGQFLIRKFPEYNLNVDDFTAAGLVEDEFDPAKALVFWLVGFNEDKSDPLKDHDKRMSGEDKSKLFEFPNERLIGGYFFMDVSEDEMFYDADNNDIYDEANDYVYLGAAYMFFDSETYYSSTSPTNVANNFPLKGRDESGAEVDYTFNPYMQIDVRGIHVAYSPDTVQIICGGQDRKFGKGGFASPPEEASKRPYSDGDADNVTNFSNGKTLQEFSQP